MATLVAGDYFGEKAILTGSRTRGETIVVGNDTELAVMTITKTHYSYDTFDDYFISTKCISLPLIVSLLEMEICVTFMN